VAARAWLLLALFSSSAAAHPLDEIVQGAYLTLVPGEVRLELDITPGTEVAGALLRALDTHADQLANQHASLMLATGSRFPKPARFSNERAEA
jgi:hypothetical protein